MTLNLKYEGKGQWMNYSSPIEHFFLFNLLVNLVLYISVFILDYGNKTKQKFKKIKNLVKKKLQMY